jgi:hypothetical protein
LKALKLLQVCGDDAEESESETEDVLWSAMAKVKTNAKRQLDNDASEDETAATTRRNVKRRKQKRKTAKSSSEYMTSTVIGHL